MPHHPDPPPQDMTDDYYHYYMASQKRVSRWISQTTKELETATPMPVPSLFDVSMGASAIRESMAGDGRRGKEDGGRDKEPKRRDEKERGKGREKEQDRGLRSTSTSTLVASSSSKTRGGDEESSERRKRKEREREHRSSSDKDRDRRKHHDLDRHLNIIEEDGPRRPCGNDERQVKKRTSSMSPPPSSFKPRVKSNPNALALDLFAPEAETTMVTETVAIETVLTEADRDRERKVTPSDYAGSAGDLMRLRRKEVREGKGKERERESERESGRRRESTVSPQKSSRSRGRTSDKLAAQDVLERRELDRERAGFRSKSRATHTTSKSKSQARDPA
ncbi:hypothetical protein FA13DRAFT_1714052 [Coprinellus micaceus]|uniref:Uncharacterized protein n=1 Tax=Coprinellus micaceus TaxID=71717 RepID=A0A4Y7STP8_COPMI|nr:hypothetical protein FA13DRAFT_1714052 [Coprinellus micaceus]